MTTQFRIIATAPTIHQHKSLSHFGMPVKNLPNGSFEGEEIFDTEEEAINYLIQRAEKYYGQFGEDVAEHLQDIEKYKQLTIDAVTARIEKIS